MYAFKPHTQYVAVATCIYAHIASTFTANADYEDFVATCMYPHIARPRTGSITSPVVVATCMYAHIARVSYSCADLFVLKVATCIYAHIARKTSTVKLIYPYFKRKYYI